MVTSVTSGTLTLVGSPIKVKEKWRERTVALLKETIQLGCVSHDSPQKKSILLDKRWIGINLHSQVLEGHDDPSRRIIQKCERQERVPCSPKFEERTQNEILRQERCARRGAWNVATDVHKLKKESKIYIVLSC